AALGLGLVFMRHIQRRSLRVSFILLAAAAIATIFLIWFHDPFAWFHSGHPAEKDFGTYLFAAQVLLGIPFFYILTFAGVEEETEVETGAMAASFAVGVGLLTIHAPQ